MSALSWSAEAAAARDAGQPLVALESAIVTHGMPWPTNRDTVAAVEAEVRAAGAEPATIAVLEGEARIGLTAEEVAALAQHPERRKISVADLGHALATGATGGTTVAATLHLAAAAGIAVFATGGIGGVHRGAEMDWDISADLAMLARAPLITVAAGAKAILDLPRTLELLESLGVPVIGYRTDHLPAFWSRGSALPLTLRAETAGEIAESFRHHRNLGLPGGLLIANPIPAADEIPAARIAPWIDEAEEAARAEGITGKAVTPFLLDHIGRRSDGAALTANVALVRNNARLAAEIAVALATETGRLDRPGAHR
ncbi:MAG: pseudouridine-5'-phosphate glycosidase [Pseudomonadota bacterium]